MKYDKVFLPVSVDERLPDDDDEKFVITNLIPYEIASFEKGEWDGDLRVQEKVTHWLEEKREVYVFSEDELKKFLYDLFDNARNINEILTQFKKQLP